MGILNTSFTESMLNIGFVRLIICKIDYILTYFTNTNTNTIILLIYKVKLAGNSSI